MNSEIPIIGQKKKLCRLCGRHSHPFTTQCNYRDLVKRIELLLEANGAIPSLLEMNKEVTTIAKTFEDLFKKTSKSLEIVEEVIKEFPEGEIIWSRFKKRLEELWPETSSQDTEERVNPSSPGNMPQSEIVNKQCTEGMTTGEITAEGSSP